MRGVTYLILLAASLVAPVAGAVTAADCEHHRDEFLASLEENRRNSIRDLDEAQRDTRNAHEKARLEQARNEAWEFEERMRARGDQILRDCMAHVRGSSG